MFRELLAARAASRDSIHWRGREPNRIESLSDAVFGFAITLLVFSVEVPKSNLPLCDDELLSKKRVLRHQFDATANEIRGQPGNEPKKVDHVSSLTSFYPLVLGDEVGHGAGLRWRPP
jgi:hypothetical protein